MHVVRCNAFFFAQRALSLYMLPKVIAKLTCGIVFAAFSLSDNYPASLWLVRGERWVFNSLLEPQRKRKFELVPYILDLKMNTCLYILWWIFFFCCVFLLLYKKKNSLNHKYLLFHVMCSTPLLISFVFTRYIHIFLFSGHWVRRVRFIWWSLTDKLNNAFHYVMKD